MAHRLSVYHKLLEELLAAGYRLHPIRDYFRSPPEPPVVYLRHDVDRIPSRAVDMAKLEAALGVCSTYYFRCDRRMCFPERVMREIAGLGHEIGFHYESLSRIRGDRAAALALFERELAACRAIAPVSTVSPHGAPLAASSNMEFTASIDADCSSLLGDATKMDFTEMLYVTDTGGTFGSPYNLRDRPEGRCLTKPVPPPCLTEWVVALGTNSLTLSCHPERWPLCMPGLMQAQCFDAAANAAKTLSRRFRQSGAVAMAPVNHSGPS